MSFSKTFRVFVSSTFADLVEERNALQQRVWPELTKLCEKQAFDSRQLTCVGEFQVKRRWINGHHGFALKN
jgi:DNA polymerase elongation subunit (family B)